MNVGDRFTIGANQGERAARVVAVTESLALLVYAMPAGREFLWEVPRAAPVENGALDYSGQPRRIAAMNPPARWRDAVRECDPVQSVCERVTHYAHRRAQRCGAEWRVFSGGCDCYPTLQRRPGASA